MTSWMPSALSATSSVWIRWFLSSWRMAMPSPLNKAVAGTINDEEARAVLLAAAKYGLMRQAGMIPANASEWIHTLKNLSDEDINRVTEPSYQLEVLLKASQGYFDSWNEVENLGYKLQMKPFMPLMPLAQTDNSLCEI